MTPACALLAVVAVCLAACQFAPFPNWRSDRELSKPPRSDDRLPRVAYIWLGPPPSGQSLFAEFLAGMRDHGWVSDQNVVIESRDADQNPANYPAVIAEAVASKPDVLVVGDSAAAPLLAEATSTIPIVLTAGGNVVVARVACQVNRPCGNVTGLSLSLVHLSPKRLEMLREVVPHVQRVGFLRNSRIPETLAELDALQAAATILGVEVIPLEFQTPDDYQSAFQKGLDAGIEALLVMPDGTSAQIWAPILRFAADYGLPDVYGVKTSVQRGGLFSYGASREYNFRRAAFYVDRILKGTSPSVLPIEQPMRFELVLNTARADQLGLNFPRSLELLANEVIR